MSETVEVQPFPFGVDVVEGREYRWCACGRSRTQPLCDDSHIGFGMGRLGYTYSFLSGRTGPRGFFMSLSLVSMYGMASYPLMSLLS